MTWELPGGGGSGGDGLTPEQETTLDLFYYDPAINKLSALRAIDATPASINIGNHNISSGGDSPFFTNTSTDVRQYPSWSGLKNYDDPANRGVGGLIGASIRQHSEQHFFFEPNGALSPTGSVEYITTWDTGAEAFSISHQTAVVAEAVQPDDYLIYQEGLGVLDSPLIFEQKITGLSLAAGDSFEWTFTVPSENPANTQGWSRIWIARGSEDATREPLLVRPGLNDSMLRYVGVDYRTYEDRPLLAGVQSVNSNTDVAHQTTYMVDTSSSAVTLTLPVISSSKIFQVSDDRGTFADNNCTITFAGIGSFILNVDYAYFMFYKSGAQWRFMDLNSGVSGVVGIDSSNTSKFGWADYNNTGAPIATSNNNWFTLTNDGAGAFTNTDYLPVGVTASNLLDTSTGRINFNELEIGDEVEFRHTFKITPNSNGQVYHISHLIGSGINAYQQIFASGKMEQGGGVATETLTAVARIYIGDANTRDGGALVQAKTTGISSVQYDGVYISIRRR